MRMAGPALSMRHLLITAGCVCLAISLGLGCPRAQAASGREQTLLASKAALVKSVQQHRQHISELDALATRAQSIHDSAVAEGNATKAEVAARAVTSARQGIANAQKYLADAEARLTAVDAALSWSEREASSAVPLLMHGTVYVYAASGNRSKLSATVPLRPGDKIETLNDGYVETIFPDGTYGALGPNTTFEYKVGDGVPVYELIQGKLHSLHNCLTGPNGSVANCTEGARYRVRVPACVIAVRGTEFTIDADPRGSVTYIVLDGSIEVRPQGAGHPIAVNKGEGLRVSKDAPAPTSADAIDVKSIAPWWQP